MAIKWRIKGYFRYGSDPTTWEELYYDDSIPALFLLRRLNYNCNVIEIILEQLTVFNNSLEGDFQLSEGNGELFQGAGVSKVEVTTICNDTFRGNPANVLGNSIELVNDSGLDNFYIPTPNIRKIRPIF